MRPQADHGLYWQADGVGTNSGVTVTKAASSAGETHYLTAVQASGDAAATIVITQGTTVILTLRFAGAFVYSFRFEGELETANDALIKTVISASTSNCEVNMQGYTC